MPPEALDGEPCQTCDWISIDDVVREQEEVDTPRPLLAAGQATRPREASVSSPAANEPVSRHLTRRLSGILKTRSAQA